MAKVGPKPRAFASWLVQCESGCLEWSGVTVAPPHAPNHRYGRVRVDGKKVLAHRRAYELARGPIPPGMKVCHSCDNPLCCNPAHLFLGTQKDNVQDSITKGRHVSVTSKFSTTARKGQTP